MHRNIKILPAAVIVWLLSSSGCGLFDTRSAEDPESTRSTYTPPTTPDIVIDNAVYSIIQKNSSNYTKCLTEGINYIPDSKAQSLYSDIFRNWNFTSERIYFENLISQTNINASSSLFLSNKVMLLLTSDSASFTSDYIFVFQHNRTNIPKTAVGNLRFSLKADDNSFFYVNKWEDFRKNDSDFTWSEMKANFSN